MPSKQEIKNRIITFATVLTALTILSACSPSPVSTKETPVIPTSLPFPTASLVSPALEVTKTPTPEPTKTPETQQDQTELWISNETISVDENGVKASFGFSLGFEHTTFTDSTIKQLQDKLAEYARDNNLTNIPASLDFGFNPNNPDAKRNQTMEILSALNWTSNIQNGTNKSLLEFTSQPNDNSFTIWAVGNKEITLTLGQIKNVKIVLTSDSTTQTERKLYMVSEMDSTHRYGYDFKNGTLTFYAPMLSTTEIDRYLFNPKYPLQTPANMIYAFTIEKFSSIETAIYSLPLSFKEKQLKDAKDNVYNLGALKDKVTIIREDVMYNGHALNFKNAFRDPIKTKFDASTKTQGWPQSAANYYAEMGKIYGNYILK